VCHLNPAASADPLGRDLNQVHGGHAKKVDGQARELEGVVTVLLLETAREQPGNDAPVHRLLTPGASRVTRRAEQLAFALEETLICSQTCLQSSIGESMNRSGVTAIIPRA
jgi:hypothetical protein